MENILLPSKIEYAQGSNPNETIVTIEPLYPGYGITIGTALRRVLMSSLTGGAAFAVKIKGVLHEFSTIPYVKEDVVDIILNLKRLRFRVHTNETVRLILRAKGERVVTGADIESSPDAEVANPDTVICEMTNKNAQIEIELFVKKGRAYFPTEARDKEATELGAIAIDALFTPLRNVGVRVENMRVGNMTNFHRIILTIETDGSITAQEAITEASSILKNHFAFLMTGGAPLAGDTEKESDGEDLMDSDEIAEALDEDEEELEDEDGDAQPKKRGRPKKGSA
ncbi:MAG: DNA-directed RNA polymerase subunit alpha [Candidatus Uhrbacteria bacterium]|nr:DNA-directed RNA polymerase subunit alpha [Candidatus Uhrbacteria bacterium]